MSNPRAARIVFLISAIGNDYGGGGLNRWLLTALWMSLISLTSSTVISTRAFTKAVVTHGPLHVTDSGFRNFWNSWWWVFVKGYHAFEFAVLAILIERALHGRYGLALLLAALFACVDEWHQTFVPARGGRITDVLIDCGGAVVGLVLVALWRRRSALR